jgi:hypothetical protein
MSATSVLQLQQPLKEGGIRSVNFFNGRLLAGKDLSREQAARREADARLGLAIGDGVAFGLDAAVDTALSEPAAPVLRIARGLAVNRRGQTLRLTADTSVALSRRFEAVAGNCVFADCAPLAGGVYVAGAGVYLLTIAPAQLGEGRAPTNGLDPGNVACNTDATVEAVQFRLLGIDQVRYADLDLGSPRFRNRLAYRCFGVEAAEAALADPWRAGPARYGLIDELRGLGLSDHDVPLALVYWTAQGIRFVDGWAVRRPLVPPDPLASPPDAGGAPPADPSGPGFVARRRRLAEAYAMGAQFHAHLTDLLASSGSLAALRATDHFRYLPPFGMVPLQRGAIRGFAPAAFFANVVRRPIAGTGQETEFIDARLLGVLQEEALAYPPTDLDAKELVRVYRPWQNHRAAAEGRAQPVAVFASGLSPDLAAARFDLARYDYSNYANCCGGS